MKPMITWKRVTNKTSSIPNLFVISIFGDESGFITKPNDSSTDKNAWRIYTGIGDTCHFIGHEYDKKKAMKKLEQIFVHSTIVG